MMGKSARPWRRAAAVGAVAAAALAAPAAALAHTSVAYDSGVVTLTGDASDSWIHVKFGTSAGHLKITLHDEDGALDGPGSGTCQAGGGDVVCTADDSHALNSVVAAGSDGDDVLEVEGSPPSTFVLSFDGGAGLDGLWPGPEKDTYSGGADFDYADYAGYPGPVNVSADGVANDGAGGETDNIGTDVEELDGSGQNDTLTATTSPPAGCTQDCTELFGLAGDDTLNGSSSSDFLAGSAGNDTLNGNAGYDSLEGDEGNDVVNGGPGEDIVLADPGADDYHGGPDEDSIYYGGEPYESGPSTPAASVNVSLDDVANDGMVDQDGSGADGPGVAAAGPAADNIHSDVEDVYGTVGNDALIGDNASNVLQGNGGNDAITGGGGSDFLIGDGLDLYSLIGGAASLPGNDTINARDNAPDVVSCGSGTDTATTDDIDTVSDCETNSVAKATLPVQIVQVPAPKDTTKAKVTVGSLKKSIKRKSFLKSGVSFTLSASEAVDYDVELTGTWKGAHVAKAGDLVLATKALKSSGSKSKVRLKLNSRAKKAIGKTAKLKLTVIAIDAGGNKTTVTRTVRIK